MFLYLEMTVKEGLCVGSLSPGLWAGVLAQVLLVKEGGAENVCHVYVYVCASLRSSPPGPGW